MIQSTLETKFNPPSIKKVEFVEMTHDGSEKEIVISYPSYSHPNSPPHYCHYFLPRAGFDYCSCPGDYKQDTTCWHIRFRPLVIKLFMNREPPCEDWQGLFELYGAHTKMEIQYYLWEKCQFKSTFTADDIMDLEIFDFEGNLKDRRVKGGAFLDLRNSEVIEKTGLTRTTNPEQHAAVITVWRWNQRNARRYFGLA